MTTKELLAKIETDGMEWVLRHYESEPSDNDSLARQLNFLAGELFSLDRYFDAYIKILKAHIREAAKTP
jgi:hypothetical protein